MTSLLGGDIDISYFRLVDRSLWESMQGEAEEKRKGYKCVIYVSKAIEKSELETLVQRLSVRDVDEDGMACLKICQSTPLRVMHRRSLMVRSKYIYDMQVEYINQHFFILSMVTSAGAYVKEFVHSDLGRTVPSIASEMHCRADILQLDVVRLYDSFNDGSAET